MKDTVLTQAIEAVVARKIEAVETVIKNLVLPLEDVGSPEKLIGKDYETWTPDDLSRLTQIYGQGDKTPLANLIFKRIFERVKSLEAQEL